MKATLRTTLALSAIGLALALAPMPSAHADELPPPATYEEVLPGVLDCDDATWTFWTVTYQADAIGYDETGVLVYSDWYEIARIPEIGFATGNGPDTDCPNWVIAGTEDNPVWVNTDTLKPHTPKPHTGGPKDEDDPKIDKPKTHEPTGKLGMRATVLKAGLGA